MSHMFNSCKELISIPDISKWNINEVNDMSGMFCECSKLLLLPNNISNWKLKKSINMTDIFKGCISLYSS